MKIVEVRTYMIDVPPPHWGGRHWIFVKLVTDEGIEGVGECTYHTRLNHVVIELIKDWGERFLKGADPFRIEKNLVNTIRGTLCSAFRSARHTSDECNRDGMLGYRWESRKPTNIQPFRWHVS